VLRPDNAQQARKMHVHGFKHLLLLSVANFGRSEVFNALYAAKAQL